MNNKPIDPPGSAMDEVLWAAYRRHDKAEVMDCLFRRSLVGIGFSGSFSQLMVMARSVKGFAARRANGGPVLTNRGLPRIPMGSTVN